MRGGDLFTQSFTSENVQDNQFKTFYFKNVKVDRKKEYVIEINSNDATDDNTLGISTFYLTNYSAYPKGILSINGEESEGDLTFQVQNEVTRPYTSKKIYIAISSIIILIEIFAFYPYLKCNNRDEKIKT